MKTLLSYWRWCLLAALLIALGFGLHGWFSPVERWSLKLNDDEWLFSFSPDGSYLISHPVAQGDYGEWAGPFRKRDAATGEFVAEMSSREILYEHHSQSDRRLWLRDVPVRKRYWAGLPEFDRGTLHLFDLQAGAEHHLPIEPHADYRVLILSRREDIVAVCHEKNPVPEDEIYRTHDIVLYAIPSGQRLAVLKKAGDSRARFAPDGAYFVYYAMKNGLLSLHAWDANKRQDGCVLTGPASDCEISPDSRYLLYEDSDGVGIWDMSNLAQPTRRGLIPTQLNGFHFLPDSRTILEAFSFRERNTLVFWDAATGKEMGKLDDPKFFDLRQGVFSQSISPDGSLFMSAFDSGGESFLAAVDMRTRRANWKAPVGESQKVVFAGDIGIVVKASEDHVALRQMRTGALLASYALPYQHLAEPVLSTNSRYVCFIGDGEKAPGKTSRSWLWEHMPNWLQAHLQWQFSLLTVIDLEDQREVFHMANSNVREAQLSPDGRTLLTTHVTVWNGEFGDWTLRCWDVPARKPWIWIIGIPAGIGVGVLAWKWVRSKRRAAA